MKTNVKLHRETQTFNWEKGKPYFQVEGDLRFTSLDAWQKNEGQTHVFVFLRVCAVPCSYTSPSDRRRHTLASPGRRSGCPTLRRCTCTGCTAGNMDADNAKLLLSTTWQAERGASRVCPRFMLHQTIKLHFKMKMLPLSSHSHVSANIKFSPGDRINRKKNTAVQLFSLLTEVTEHQKG